MPPPGGAPQGYGAPRPPGPPPGPMGMGPPSSAGMPINMPNMSGPPSTVSGGLAGIPPAGMMAPRVSASGGMPGGPLGPGMQQMGGQPGMGPPQGPGGMHAAAPQGGGMGGPMGGMGAPQGAGGPMGSGMGGPPRPPSTSGRAPGPGMMGGPPQPQPMMGAPGGGGPMGAPGGGGRGMPMGGGPMGGPSARAPGAPPMGGLGGPPMGAPMGAPGGGPPPMMMGGGGGGPPGGMMGGPPPGMRAPMGGPTGMNLGGPPPMMGGPPPIMGGPPPMMGGGGMGPPPGAMGMGMGPPSHGGGGGMGMPPPPGHGPPGGGAHAQGPTASSNSSSQRIDPASIPRPVAPSSSGVIEFATRVSGSSCNPPPAASRFVVRDRGSAGPRYMRSTLSQVPCSADLTAQGAMPLSVMVCPLALPEPDDDQLPVVDMGELVCGPVRCTRCKAYMNPYMRFMSSGKTFVCNFCGTSNATPDHYFCHLGPDGQRRDAYERAELSRGSVEFVATKDYMIRTPMPNSHFFAIEATPSAVASGATASVCACVAKVLDAMPAPERSQVGIATFDSSVHFYSLRPGSTQPHMLIMGNASEPFVPDSAPVIVPLAEHKEALQALLEAIPGMFGAPGRTNECAGGAAIEAAVSALSATGGKVHAFLCTLPTSGLHPLKLRDSAGLKEGDKLNVLNTQDGTLHPFASKAADLQVCIDVSLLAQGYMDVASLSVLTTSTGGTLYQYTPFSPALDHDQVLNDLKWNVVRPQGNEAVMRVRASTGIMVDSYQGAFVRSPGAMTDVYLPAIDCDKAVIAHVRHVDKLSAGADCYLQAALLYSTVDGHRRIRVHTIAMPVVDSVSAMFKGADLDAQTMVLTRRCAANLPGGSLAACREAVTSGIVATLAAYRKYCASQSSAVQLILPEALKLLPLYALSTLKGPGLRDGVRLDDRSMWAAAMMSFPAARVSPLLYARLLPLRPMLDGAQDADEISDGMVLSSEGLEQGGVYLLENGADALLHMDKLVSPELVHALTGAGSYEELCRVPGPVVLLPREERASRALQDLLVKVRMNRSSFGRLRVTRKGDPHEAAFFTSLVEDRSSSGMSYVEYLCQVHRLIQLKMN
ncbi:hypothetical protein FOA52_007002 [Chlamydomonas sp. UWO 241]|nr:hypothetical protein FOA52_007002 [Chlamydomonas sp. UWO 241]